MSRAPHEATHVPNAGFSEGDYQYPPQSAQNQASNFVDGSGPIFSMYMEMATEEDKKMAENWKADADGILIFTGLFSAAVASLISVSIQDIRPNPQDTSNFYLANIYQTIADPNISTSLPASPPQFSPPNYAVWVNSFWFMSLVISLTCALLATLLQQWARRYLKVTQSRYSPHKRARIRSFFAEGVDKYFLPLAVETLPALLHISLFLFFAGLVVFLCNVNISAFILVLSWVGICTGLYGCITLMPIFRLDSPYYTSLSSSAWFIVIGIRYLVAEVRWWFCWSVGRRDDPAFRGIWDGYHELLFKGIRRAAEEAALNPRSEIDTRAFMWTFDRLDDDHELERFFSGLPGFRTSKEVDDPLPSLTHTQQWKLFEPLTELLDRTFSSDLLPAPVKKRRAMICAKAVDPTYIRTAFRILRVILSNDQDIGLLAADILQTVRSWCNNGDEDIALVTQAIVSSAIAHTQRRDDRWFILASNELGVQESVLREYAAHGNSLSLSILIHVTRRLFDFFCKRSQARPLMWPGFSGVLIKASRFDVQDTSPELQHEFCTLWNDIILKGQNARLMAVGILRPIRNVYFDLHRNTDSAPTRFSPSTDSLDDILLEPSSYPVCNVAGHIHDDSTSTTLTRSALHDAAALAPASESLANPNAPSSSVLSPHHVDKTLTDIPPRDNDIYAPISVHPAHHTPTENPHIPPTSQDPVTAHTCTTSTPLSTPEHLAPTLSPNSVASASAPGAVAIQNITGRRTSSDVFNDPSLPSPTPVLDNMLPTGPQLSSDFPVTESDRTYPFTGSRSSPRAAPGLSHPLLSSAPHLGAAAEGEGGAGAVLHMERDVVDIPLAICENIVSPSSVTDLDIVGPSRRPPGAEHTADHPLHPSHSQYNIV